MPCTPPKVRTLLKEGKAHGRRNKLGLFYIQLTYEQEPENQQLVIGIDPGSKFEGYSVVGTQENCPESHGGSHNPCQSSSGDTKDHAARTPLAQVEASCQKSELAGTKASPTCLDPEPMGSKSTHYTASLSDIAYHRWGSGGCTVSDANGEAPQAEPRI
jgi:hypothetical protein